MDAKTIKRFWAKVLVKDIDECWLWTGYIKNKYGYIGYSGSYTYAHRLAWIIEHGDIPEGMFVCHTCDNPGCVNPAHLFLGTHSDNIKDMFDKGRGVNNTGEKNGNARLTVTQVLEIRQLATTGKSYRNIGNQYGISSAQVSRIVNKTSWAHV